MSPSRRLFCLLLLPILANAAFAQTAAAPGIAWSGKDAQGGAVVMPSATKATVVVCVRPGQEQSDEVMKAIAAFRDRADVQIVAVVSGDDAAALAGVLARNKWTGPVVIDSTYVLSGKLSVNVWPTTVVVARQTGAVEAHLAGAPASFSNDLAAHVDFAAGKIDRAARDKVLANRAVVAESTELRAARHIEVARRLAAKEMADEARAELALAVELKPSDGQVLASMARVHLLIHNPQAALAVLGQIKEGSGPTSGEVNLLRGWAAVQMEQWADAKKLLIDATRLNPDPAEAFYLLGRVSEHDGQAAQAAEYYRKAFEKSESGKQMGAVGAVSGK